MVFDESVRLLTQGKCFRSDPRRGFVFKKAVNRGDPKATLNAFYQDRNSARFGRSGGAVGIVAGES
jgi:hypothetical protein